MTIDRDVLLRVAAQRAGFSESQLDALRRRDYAAVLAAVPPVGPDPLAVDDDPGPDPQVELVRLARRLGAVQRQRDAALGVLHQLAGRLGCCPRCWGTDAACPTCAGRGSPGFTTPDPGLLEWLAPALRRASGPSESSVPSEPAVPFAPSQSAGPGPARPFPVPAAAPAGAPDGRA